MIREKSWQQTLDIAYGGGPAKGYTWMQKDEADKVEAQLLADPNNFSLLTARGIFNLNYDPAVAMESFSRALAIQPFNAHQYYNRGRVYLNTGRTTEGIADLALSVRLDAEDNWKWHFLGVGTYFTSDYRKAITYFEKAMEVSERHNQDLISCEVDWIWACYAKLGEMDKAREIGATVTPDVKIVPVIGDDEGYRDQVLMLNGTIPVEEFEKSVSSANEGGSYGGLYALARYYRYVANDLPKAVEYLRRVIATEPPPEDRGHGVLSRQKGWGYRMALHDSQEWEAALAAQQTSKA